MKSKGFARKGWNPYISTFLQPFDKASNQKNRNAFLDVVDTLKQSST